MISQKARLSEGPLVRKSDNYLIGIISFVDNPVTNKLIFVFIYLFVAATKSSTVMGCVYNKLLIMFLNAMLLI